MPFYLPFPYLPFPYYDSNVKKVTKTNLSIVEENDLIGRISTRDASTFNHLCRTRAIDISQGGFPDDFLFVESPRVCIRRIFLSSYNIVAVKSFRRLNRERGKIENCHNAAVVMIMPRNIGVHGHRA